MKKLLTFLFAVCISYISFAQSHYQATALNGRWIFVSSSQLDLGKIPDDKLPDLNLEDSAKIFSGSAGCNKITGSYETEANQFIFGPMISTYKACPDMEVEKFIIRFLPLVGSYKVEDNKLYLYDKNDKSKFVVYRRS